MKRVRHCLFLAVILGVSLATPAWSQQGVQWQPALETAKRVAGQTNRLVLVHFWAEWCKPCVQMERDVFSRPAVTAAIESGYVPVKVNVDHFPATVRQYGVSIVPTDVVLTADGQLVDKLIGMSDPAQYAARLSQITQSRAPQAAASYGQVASLPGPAADAYQQPTPAYPGQINPYYQQPTPSYQQPFASYQPPAVTNSPVASEQNRDRPAVTQPQLPDNRYADYYSQQAPSSSSPANPPAVAPWSLPVPSAVETANTGSPEASRYQIPAVPDARDYQTPAPREQDRATSPYPNQIASRDLDRPALNDPPQDTRNDPPQETLSAEPNIAPEQTELAAPVTDSLLAAQLPPGSPPLALDGFCPVRLTDEEGWVRGDVRWGARHDGRTYLFAGPAEQQKFLKDPQRYAPVLSGNDVVIAVDRRQIVPGRREFGVWYGGNVYLFSNPTSYQRFNVNADRYVEQIQQSAGAMAQRPDAAPAASVNY